MLTNLILLPSLLLSLEQNVITKSFKNSEDYFYDDSDIELDKLKKYERIILQVVQEPDYIPNFSS